VEDPVLAKIKKNILFMGSVVGNYLVFLPVFRKFKQRYPKITVMDTDICIDGYPRSGNSYFVSAFLHWNPGINVSHHTHLAGSVKYALQRGLPTIVLIRRPEDVVSSVLAWDGLLDTNVALASYIHFYETLWKHRKKYLVFTFDDVIKGPDICVQRINQHFNRQFLHTDFSSGVDAEIRARLEKVDLRHNRKGVNSSLPNDDKAQLKKKYLESVLESPLFPRAERQFLKYSRL
jgi:hypothetical protein